MAHTAAILRSADSDERARKARAADPAPSARVPGPDLARVASSVSKRDLTRATRASVLALQSAIGNRAVAGLAGGSRRPVPPAAAIDVVTTEEGDDGTNSEYIDATATTGGRRTLSPQNGGAHAPADAGAPAAPAVAAVAAVPTNFQQVVTGWVPGPNRYGFQLKFRCSSSTGAVADLQSQANLKWREYVTYRRNDFAHRITFPDPTITPPGGVSFAPSRTTVISPNVLEFNGVTDTHWFPTSAVREADFPPTGAHTFPAMVESNQVYQYSTDGSSWTTFSGPHALRRTFDRQAGPPAPGGSYPQTFTTEKVGIHMVVEPYKP